MNNLTLVIPAKNEKESLPNVLNELKKFKLKILIILESEDVETINSIKDFDCKILKQSKKGYGNALIEGIKETKTKYFCIFNADGSFNPEELKEMYHLAEKENFDLVFGSRYEKNAGSDDDTIVTYVGNKIFSFIGKFFFSLTLTDILYTYVLGNTEKVNKLKLIKNDFGFCVELPIKAKKAGLKLTTNSSFERKRIAGKKKVNALKDGFKILMFMIALYLNLV